MRSITISLLVLFSAQSLAQSQQAINNEAVKMMNNENYKDALALLDPLVTNYPSVTAYRYNRAVTFFNLKQYREAIRDYKVLMEASPESEYAFQIGNAYDHIDSLSTATTYYSKAIDIDQDNYMTYFKRGTVYLKQSLFAKAIDDFTRSFELNPAHHNSLHNRAIALYHSKKQELACEDWCKAVELGNPYSMEHLQKNCKTIPLKCR
jgi:tetratricopeptide (TPR) repeat protein